MADIFDFATDATQTSGTESGSAPTADPGAAAVAQGFVQGQPVRARWINWAIKGLVDKMRGAATIALTAVLKYSLAGITTWIVPEQGSFALGTGASARIKLRFSYVRTTDATANVTLDSYGDLPADSVLAVLGFVLARNKTTATESAAYFIRHAFENNGGTVAAIGSVNLLAQEDDAVWASTMSASSPNVLTTVTGEAAQNIDWFMFSLFIEFTAAT